jgi:hypothetical protein
MRTTLIRTESEASVAVRLIAISFRQYGDENNYACINDWCAAVPDLSRPYESICNPPLSDHDLLQDDP